MVIGLEVYTGLQPMILAAQVEKLAKDIRSFREPLHRSVKDVLAPSIRKNFDVGGRPTWIPLADSTIRKKGHDRPLIQSGTLRRVASQLNIWTITSDTAQLKGLPNSVGYGYVHQYGAEQYGESKGKSFVRVIPARPFLMMQDEDQVKIAQIFDEWMEERVAHYWSKRR